MFNSPFECRELNAPGVRASIASAGHSAMARSPLVVTLFWLYENDKGLYEYEVEEIGAPPMEFAKRGIGISTIGARRGL
ncbi:MAG TPA: hypothetical protein VJ464_08785 [Blastocatellia bacterium]|nr:hypothetical protein [Blastocatellia bacterium]